MGPARHRQPPSVRAPLPPGRPLRGAPPQDPDPAGADRAPALGLVDAWRAALAEPRLRVLVAVAPVLVVVVLLEFHGFLERIELRSGVQFTDPLLVRIPPHDLSLPIFALLGMALVAGVVRAAFEPRRLLAGLLAYAAMVCMRALVMYLLPLDPPAGLVLLKDPFVELFGQQRTLTRDLFFSGHTATLTVLTLSAPAGRVRLALAVATLLVAAGVLVHHAHYTVDVVAAPFFAYCCHRLAVTFVDIAAPAVTASSAAR